MRLSITRDVRPLIIFGLLAGSFMYSVKLGPSPVYAVVPLAAALALMATIARPSRYLSSIPIDVIIAAVLAAYGVATQRLGSELVNFELAMMAYIAIRLLGRRMTAVSLQRLFNGAAWACAIVLLVDSIYRLLNPGTPEPVMYEAIIGTSREFYIYKYNTLMFAHSNATAMVALCFLATGVKLRVDGDEKNNALFFALALVIVLSFSRAAYLATALLAALYFYPRLSPWLKVIAIGAVPFLGIVALAIFQDDGSLGSKLSMWTDAFTYAESWHELLFGIGLGETVQIAGLAQHVLPLTYATEMGLIGIGLVAIFLLTALRRDPRSAIVLVPILVLSLSHFLYAGMAFFTAPFALAICHRSAPLRG